MTHLCSLTGMSWGFKPCLLCRAVLLFSSGMAGPGQMGDNMQYMRAMPDVSVGQELGYFGTVWGRKALVVGLVGEIPNGHPGSFDRRTS